MWTSARLPTAGVRRPVTTRWVPSCASVTLVTSSQPTASPVRVNSKPRHRAGTALCFWGITPAGTSKRRIFMFATSHWAKQNPISGFPKVTFAQRHSSRSSNLRSRGRGHSDVKRGTLSLFWFVRNYKVKEHRLDVNSPQCAEVTHEPVRTSRS